MEEIVQVWSISIKKFKCVFGHTCAASNVSETMENRPHTAVLVRAGQAAKQQNRRKLYQPPPSPYLVLHGMNVSSPEI